jgi:cytochrome c oxidase accessory protein FixG
MRKPAFAMAEAGNNAGSDRFERFDVEAIHGPGKPKLYVARSKIHPKRASGDFRKLKWIIMAVTLGIYYVTPWLRWDRGPYAPDQAVLVDIAHRRFYFFFIEIWPQEFYYIAGLLIMAGIGLFLVTSIAGRAWCGYTCPQTVWTDLFLVVERWVEGDRNARIKLDGASWSFDKLRKRIVKHAIWLVIAMATGGAWIFYFADAPTLASQFLTLSAPSVAYATVAILTATTYVFAGFMREQVCIYMCPWPRIQAAMLDEESLVVTYNAWRGEPRAAHRKKREADGQAVGDCVDCNACVAVCPMGIDIRDGQQLACITCALCIDACNSVMGKVGKPSGLISYSNLETYNARAGGQPAKLSWRMTVRPRTVIYSALLATIATLMIVGLAMRERLDINVVPDRNPLFVTLSDGSIRNGYTIRVLNMRQQPRLFSLSLEGLPNGLMRIIESGNAAARSVELTVEADKARSVKIYVTAPAASLVGESTDFTFVISAHDPGETAETNSYEAIFHGPAR